MAFTRMNPAAEVRLYAWLALLAVSSGFILGIGQVPLFDVDEGAFSQATMEMLARQDFISTYLNDQPRYDKPVLSYWLQAASVSWLGPSEWAFRLPSVLCALAWAGVLFWFARKTVDMRHGWIAVAIMATSLEIALMGKAATADPLLNALLAATLFLLYHALPSVARGAPDAPPVARYLYLAAATAGLGVLTKGPVAVAIPAAVSLLYCLSYGAGRTWLRLAFNPLAWTLFLLIAAPWYLLQYLKEGDAFIQGFFFKHNLGRFQQAMEGHTGGWWYYLPVILLGLIPYTAALLLALRDMRQWWQIPWARFGLIWLAVALVLFSASATKLPHYIVYGYSGVLVILAVQPLPNRWWIFLPAGLLLATFLALPAWIPAVLPHIHDTHAQAMLADSPRFFDGEYYGWTLAALVLTAGLAWDQRWPALPKLIILGIFMNLWMALAVLPAVADIQQRPVKEAALRYRAAGDSHAPLVMWRIHTPSFSVYAGRVAQRRDPQPGDIVLTQTRHCAGLPPHQVLYQQQGVTLLQLADEPLQN